MEFKDSFETEFVENYGPTEPVNSPGASYGGTLPPEGQAGFEGNFGPTEPADPSGLDWGDSLGYPDSGGVFPGKETMDETLPPENGNGFTTGDFKSDSAVEDYEDATMPVIMNGIDGFTPVVGWLVSVDGPSKGADFRLRAGYNYIGRSEHMDVCIKGDKMIGRERHAMVAYDPEERVFFFGPVDGKSTVRLNGKMVMVPSELHANDLLKIGSTQLMFVPLCGERFNWDV